jgi:hypothetical protein
MSVSGNLALHEADKSGVTALPHSGQAAYRNPPVDAWDGEKRSFRDGAVSPLVTAVQCVDQMLASLPLNTG